jgi:hypothetical protein
VLLLSDQRSLVLGQCTSDSSSLLVSQVEGKVCIPYPSVSHRFFLVHIYRNKRSQRTLGVLLLVHFPDILPLLLVDDGQDSGNGLSGGVAIERVRRQRKVRMICNSQARLCWVSAVTSLP